MPFEKSLMVLDLAVWDGVLLAVLRVRKCSMFFLSG